MLHVREFHFCRNPHFMRWLTSALLFLAVVFPAVVLDGSSVGQAIPAPSADKTAVNNSVPLPAGPWRFIVSGDSRNCGDVVMPTIAAHSAQFTPSFYWHLGDLRAIYKIDEDMAFEATSRGQTLACEDYERRVWNDFVEDQIAPFGSLPFYVGIGNHEVIPPKTEDAFKRQFPDWLDQPALHNQRLAGQRTGAAGGLLPLDSGWRGFHLSRQCCESFSDEQVAWLGRRLESAKNNPAVKSVVVGMHESLPDSMANFHSMGDNAAARPSGEKAYKALISFRDVESQAGLSARDTLAFLYGKYFRYGHAEGEWRQASAGLDRRNSGRGAVSAASGRSADSEDGCLWLSAGHGFSGGHNRVFV